MKTTHKFFSLFTLLAILTMAITTPALAFEGRGGENVIIGTDEVINDDLYVTAQNFTLEGTVKGDLFVMGETITVNGTVEGDLFAAGQTVVINGTVSGDARIAGAALQLGEEANVAEDLLAGGASLETRDGSKIGGDLLFGSAQALLAGDVARDVTAGTGALDLRGEFGGDVNVEVGDATEGEPAPSMYMPNVRVSIPSVTPGLTISKDAVIQGDLVYTQTTDLDIPSGVVVGKITRNEPTVDVDHVYIPPTPGEVALTWTFNLFRSIATLILFGLLLSWLAPKFVATLGDKVQTAPGASLGWGVVAFAAFFFTLLMITVAMIIGAILFGVMTLGGVSGSIIWVGLLCIFALTVGFILVTAFLTKIVAAWLTGKWLLGKLNPSLAENRIWPLVLGVLIVALLISLPLVGWLFGVLITLAGLGAFWIWGQEIRQARKIAVV